MYEYVQLKMKTESNQGVKIRKIQTRRGKRDGNTAEESHQKAQYLMFEVCCG